MWKKNRIRFQMSQDISIYSRKMKNIFLSSLSDYKAKDQEN